MIKTLAISVFLVLITWQSLPGDLLVRFIIALITWLILGLIFAITAGIAGRSV